MDKVESDSLKKLDLEFKILAEIDEQWSYIKNKKNQRWLAVDKNSKKIICFEFGKRDDATFMRLKANLDKYNISKYYTDDWGSYKRKLNPIRHFIGKDQTYTVENKNLKLRNAIKRLNRKTIGFSKSETIHDNVIGSYINTYMF